MEDETNEDESCTEKSNTDKDQDEDEKEEAEFKRRRQIEKQKTKKKRESAKANIDGILKKLCEFKSKEQSLESVLQSLNTYTDIKDNDKLRLIDTDRMNSALEKLEKDLSINCELLEKSSFTPAEVIKRSTALDGIYFAKDKKDWLVQKCPIADVKGKIFFKSPCKSETQKYEDFYDMEVKHTFDRAVDISGVDFAAKLCFRALVKEGAGGYDHNKKKENVTDKKNDTMRVTLNRTLYSVVPVVSWEPTMYNIKLAKEPINHLKNISSLLQAGAINNAKTSVLKFFDKYGSHFYFGKSHLGGMIKIATTYESDGKESEEYCKNLVHSQHSVAIEAALSFTPFISVSGEGSWNYSGGKVKSGTMSDKKEHTRIENSITKHGGPLEVDSVPIWKRGLIDNNRTWVVVSSGEPEITEGKLKIDNYVGVWELVLNEAECFKDNALKLSKFLLEMWCEQTEFAADTSAIDLFEIQLTEKRFKTFIKGIKAKMKPTLLPKLLSDLHAEVVKTRAVAACHGLWKRELVGNKIIHDLFEKLTSINLDEGQEDDVKSQFKELIQLADNAIFPCKHDILFWLNRSHESYAIPKISFRKMKSVDEFINHLKEPYIRQKRLHLSELGGNKEKEILLHQKMTTEIASSTYELLTFLRKDHDHIMYVYFLSLLLLLDYDIEQYAFRSYLTTTRLESFLSIVSESLIQFHQIGKKGLTAVELFVFHQLFTTIKKMRSKEYDAQCLYNEVHQHLEDMTALFQSQISKSLRTNLSDSLRCLQNIIDRNDINKRPVIMWNYFEKLPEFSKIEVMDKENVDPILTTGNEILHLLDLFGWKKYFPGKLTIKNVLSLHQMNSCLLKEPAEIAWIMLRKIMSTDFNYREQVLQDFVETLATTSKGDSVDDDDDDLCKATTSARGDDHTEGQWENLSPTDVFLAIFHCCDPFLKQIIVQKISVCQLAVPYFYTDCSNNRYILSLFPLRDVFYDCRSESVATASLKTVSFIRIGNGLAKSKSKTINELLRNNNEEHSTFFHRDCPRGMTKRTISKGLVEATWYVPREDAKYQVRAVPYKQIPEPITVLNLRGDATEFVEEIGQMIMVSNIIIIFIKYKDLKNDKYTSILVQIHTSSCLVLLLTDATKKDIELDDFAKSYKNKVGNSRFKLLSTFDMNLEREMNADEQKNFLRKNITQQLKKIEKGINLDKVVDLKPILTDETSVCSEMQLKAKLLYQQIHTSAKPSSCRKQHFTPLQCEHLWQEWSVKQKEHKRQTNQTQCDSEEVLPQVMQSLRKKQAEKCNEMPNIVAEFLKILLLHIDDKDSVNHFLFFFRQQLDNDSKIIIPKLQEDFALAFANYQSQTVKSLDLKSHINEIENELARASFGLEHFFREIGQIYEAFLYCQEELEYTISYKTWNIINTMPITVAKLLLLGQPLELMDGDAANVPLKWIAAVFDQLKQILQNGKLLSISVLGIQSSGKSTLLNTMFGLRFAVSAGRCTRGLYVQIIPVDKKESSLKSDYAMVIDTEGLRAPELASSKINHDNELATLVIGLADTVLINIKGETIADMENVLQIVVHGLLRLKQANKKLHLQQRCIFVHQNVSAEDATNKMLQGNKNIVERLDKMTVEVAVQEGIPNISCFKDVIDFDPTKDVRFLPDLWNGTRPMAPASTTYSSKAVEIRASILEYASTSQNVFMNVEDKTLHLKHLWDGILNDNFVFSFRNCLEVKAYSLLESEFQGLLSTLDIDKLEWMVENIKPRLFKQTTNDQLDSEAASLKNDFTVDIKQKGSDTKKRLVNFITKSELSHIMITWKAHKLQYLCGITDTMVQDVEKKIRHEKQQRLCSLFTDDKLAEKKQQINLRAKEVALSFKDRKLTTDDIKEQFKQLWVTWINELIPETAEEKIEIKDRKLEEDIKAVLYEKFVDQIPLINAGLKKNSLHNAPVLVDGQLKNSLKEVRDSNLTANSFIKKIKGIWKGPPKQPILDTINGVFFDIDETFESLFRQETEYEISQLRQIVAKIKAGCKIVNDKHEFGYSFTPKFEVFIALHVARHSYKKFKELNREYDKEHGLRNRLLRYKPQAQQLFIDVCQAKSQEMIATKIMCTTLKDLVKERVQRNLPLKIQRDIVNMYFNQKRIILKNVLEELAEKNVFKEYMDYIRAPDKYVRIWIKKKTDNVVFYTKLENKSKYEGWVENDIETYIDSLIDAIRFASKKCSNDEEGGITIKYWLDILTGQVEPMKLLLRKDTFQDVTEYTIVSFSEFGKNIVEELKDNMKSNLKDDFRSRSPKQMKWPGENPYENIFEALWGCTKTCPLCEEPCQNSMANHVSEVCHTCIQHRPSGICGIRWTKSKKLWIEICNFEVQSSMILLCGQWCDCQTIKTCRQAGVYHPCKDYKLYSPDWDIAPSSSNSAAPFWMWFMNSHKKNLAEYYQTELPDIPHSWDIVTKKKAIQSLSNIYGT